MVHCHIGLPSDCWEMLLNKHFFFTEQIPSWYDTPTTTMFYLLLNKIIQGFLNFVFDYPNKWSDNNLTTGSVSCRVLCVSVLRNMCSSFLGRHFLPLTFFKVSFFRYKCLFLLLYKSILYCYSHTQIFIHHIWLSSYPFLALIKEIYNVASIVSR